MSTQTLSAKPPRRERGEPLDDKRRSRRQTYVRRQLVALFDGTRLPQQDEFEWAMFRDVSSTGVAFLSENKPSTKQLVVAVGPAPFTFLVVEVVRTTKRDDLDSRPYHIGCRIVRELND